MAVLVLKLNGQAIGRFELEEGKEYIAGRAHDAPIRLDSKKGISRHHLKIFERDGIWVCEALSKFGLLQVGTESTQVLELSEPCSFVVAPYEFVFEPTPPAEPAHAEEKNLLPAI